MPISHQHAATSDISLRQAQLIQDGAYEDRLGMQIVVLNSYSGVFTAFQQPSSLLEASVRTLCQMMFAGPASSSLLGFTLPALPAQAQTSHPLTHL